MVILAEHHLLQKTDFTQIFTVDTPGGFELSIIYVEYTYLDGRLAINSGFVNTDAHDLKPVRP